MAGLQPRPHRLEISASRSSGRPPPQLGHTKRCRRECLRNQEPGAAYLCPLTTRPAYQSIPNASGSFASTTRKAPNSICGQRWPTPSVNVVIALSSAREPPASMLIPVLQIVGEGGSTLSPTDTQRRTMETASAATLHQLLKVKPEQPTIVKSIGEARLDDCT